MICSPRQPLMKLSTLQLESLICMIVQLTTPYTGKLAFNDGVKLPYLHRLFTHLALYWESRANDALYDDSKNSLFLTIIAYTPDSL